MIDLDRAKNKITKEDLVFGNTKKKYVNIKDDEDFPDLGEDEDPFAALDEPKKKTNNNNRRAPAK